MKIISVINNYDLKDPTETATIYLPDSALLNSGKPLFLPEFDSDFRLYPSIAIKLSRLGKAISPRFAHRYVESAAIGLNTRAHNIESKIRAEGLPWGECAVFDGAAVTGEFFDIDIDNPPAFSIYVNGERIIEWDPDMMKENIAETIHRISIRNTLKIGDLIFPALTQVGIPINMNDQITGHINNKELLKFNIK